MDIRTAAHIVYGKMPVGSINAERARRIVFQAVEAGYKFSPAGNILATPSCPDYATALKIRDEAANFLNAADYHETMGDTDIAFKLSTKAYALLDAIPAQWQGSTDRVESF